MTRLWIVGAGGHAKVVIDAALATGRFEVAGLLDDRAPAPGSVLGFEVLGRPDTEDVARLGVTDAVVAVGSNRARESLVARLGASVRWATIIHSAAYVGRDVEIAEGTVICAGAIIQPSCQIGRHGVVNTSASVDHDCRIGDFVHVAPGSRLAGGVIVGDFALLGIGSCVLPGRRIGQAAVLGAGAVAVKDVPAGVVAVGVPARPTSLRTADL